MTSAPEATVDGIRLTPQNLEQVVRDAVQGVLPIDDIEAAMDPNLWLRRVVQTIGDGALAGALRDVVSRLFESSSFLEVAAAVHLQRTGRLLDGDALWKLFFAQMAKGNQEAGAGILQALVLLSGQGVLVYDAKLRGIDLAAASSRLRAIALTLLGKHDATWLVEHPELFGTNDAARVESIGNAASELDADELTALRDGLVAKLGSLPAALPIDAMIAARRAAASGK